MKSDIEIQNSIKLDNINDIAKKYHIDEKYLINYGKYKAKVDLDITKSLKNKDNGKLVLVTSINPTPYGEGKTTMAIGLTDSLCKLGKNAIVALRERNFDEDGVIEISPAVYNVFKNNLVELKTNNDELIRKGIVGMYDDFNVIMSNNLAEDGTSAFAGQINEVEALRAEKRFKDIVRGLDTFGAKVIDDERIQVIKVPIVHGSL